MPESLYNFDTYVNRFGSWTSAKEKARLFSDGDVPQSSNISFGLLKDQNTRLLNELQRERQKTEMIVEACRASISKLDFKPVNVSKKQKTKTNLEFHSLRSDEQVGMVVDPRRTQQLGQYNFETYLKYLEKWGSKIIQFKEEDGPTLGLNKLILVRLGDHVEGEAIYLGQAFHIDRPAVDQIFQSLEVEVNILLRLAQLFSQIEIFCVVGNHGRPGKKGMNHPRTNWDYILNRLIKIAVQGQQNIKMFVSDDPVMLVRHGQFNFCYKHGEHVRGWMGIPFYGLERDFNRLPNLYGMQIHYECVGHHHQPANIKDNILMNGCFPGPTDLSVNVMTQATRPSQKIFYFDSEKGINRESNLYLSSPIQLEIDENRIYTAYS